MINLPSLSCRKRSLEEFELFHPSTQARDKISTLLDCAIAVFGLADIDQLEPSIHNQQALDI